MGHEEIALIVVQAALFRISRGRVESAHDVVSQVTEKGWFRTLAIEATERASFSVVSATTLASAALIAGERGDYSLARRAHGLSALMWRDIGDRDRQAIEMLRTAASAHNLGDYSAARATASDARQIFRALGDTRGETLVLLNTVQSLRAEGDWDGALASLNEARALANSIRDGHITASIALEHAIQRAESGDSIGAHRWFYRAYRSAARRGDSRQALVAAKNLAVVADERGSRSGSVAWWGKAGAWASEAHDWREIQGIERTRGIEIAELGRFDEALTAFDHAIEINTEHEDDLNAARSRADKGVVLLKWALSDGVDDQKFEELTTAAEETIDGARRELERLEDYEWAEIAVQNLCKVWMLQRRESLGVVSLTTNAKELATSAPEYSAEVLRNAAWLSLSGGIASDTMTAVTWLIHSAAARTDNVVEKAWSLAHDAATLATHDPEHSLLVYDAALAGLSTEHDAAAYGNILNDAALAAADAGALDDAGRRLRQVQNIARSSNDRVLLALATGNLGEIAFRQDDNALARECFSLTAVLAEQIGDLENAALALASAANAFVDDGFIDDAEKAAEQAFEIAERSGSGNALSRAISAIASANFARGNYEKAFELWSECAERASNGNTGEYQAFALDSLAQIGEWPRFRRALEGYASAAQATGTQFAFIERLHLSALTWLRKGRPRAAGTVLAYGILLAFDAATKSVGSRGRIRSTSERELEFVRVGGAMGIARALFVLIDIPKAQAKTLRRAYERTIARVAGEDADALIELVDRYALADGEED